jgi:hypothetical protein
MGKCPALKQLAHAIFYLHSRGFPGLLARGSACGTAIAALSARRRSPGLDPGENGSPERKTEMTKQVTATFTVTVRSLWHQEGFVKLEDGTIHHKVLDEEGKLVALFLGFHDAQSCCTDHNRTTRQRAKQREHRKADAKSGHQEHSEEADPDGETEETRVEEDQKARNDHKDRVVKCKCGHTNIAHEYAAGQCDDCKCTKFRKK